LFDDTTLGHLIAMTHLAHEPSAVLSISSPNCPSARTILWHTPPVISKTATDAELARDWTYDLFTEPDLPEHELEAFRHRLGPLDPLQPRPADREFHDDRYLTDHQRSLDIGSRLDFNTLSL
jgi:hypothetical protein